MPTLAEQLEALPALQQMVVPDLWQQEAVMALRQGHDVVVHAPTGAGKTLIFELWSNQGKNRGQAIYTVPTRALANDKLAEWRARDWNVGITTGDLSENLDAPVLVATLETQKHRLIRGDGPQLLVVDEYQMLADEDRGLNYELALALTPPHTQLLLLSGSVANPQDVVKWLRRLGRDAVLVRHDLRPVPLEEVHTNSLSFHLPSEIRAYWPRLVAKALAEDLGPILIFAPRRQMAESLAGELMRQLPNPHPLSLTPNQRQWVGENLLRMLKCRIAYHHSGLSYVARAGVVEPLAKAGQLRVVVATMGLAAGINFSLRSVALAADSYRRDQLEQALRPDEILQMYGRAGRRGIDETGFVLVSANELRMRDGYPRHLARSGMVDWAALLGLMSAATDQGRPGFAEAVRVQERLFTTKPIVLGVESSLRHPEAPCGLQTDAERARHVRRRVRQLLNSRGEWQDYPPPSAQSLGSIFVLEILTGDRPVQSAAATPQDAASPPAQIPSEIGDSKANGAPAASIADIPGAGVAPVRLRPALAFPAVLERIGTGTLCVVGEQGGHRIYGRAQTAADLVGEDRVVMAKWARKLAQWNSRQAPRALWESRIAPSIEARLAGLHTPLVRWIRQGARLVAQVSLAELTVKVPCDQQGVALWRPPEREVMQRDCAACALVETCRALPPASGVALTWRRLGLVDAQGTPTRRGRLVSFFSQGDGLAIAAALEDSAYDLKELVYDLANLDASFRFCGDENRWGGRMALACQERFGLLSIPGYLENGLPPKYGVGAEQVVASVHRNPASKHAWVKELVGEGDIDRVIIEWRSLLRQIAHAPPLDWPRWLALQGMARAILRETESPTVTDLPALEFHQTRRVDHRLILRRH
jgi:superfamily II DNA/RNA helicase